MFENGAIMVTEDERGIEIWVFNNSTEVKIRKKNFRETKKVLWERAEKNDTKNNGF